MKVRIIYSLLFLGLFDFGYTQSPDHDRLLIQSVNNYRRQLLLGDEELTFRLKTLLNKWEELGASREEMILFSNRVSGDFIVGVRDVNEIIKHAGYHFPGSLLLENLTAEDVLTITNNTEILSLVFEGILEYDYPFKVSPGRVFEEFGFYDIQKNDKIAEIGAGFGAISLLIAMTYSDTKVWVNEIDRYSLILLEHFVKTRDHLFLADQVEVVKGGYETTALENMDLSKIILRRVLHHFTYPKDMLKSIKRSLEPDGKLFVYEIIPSLNSDGYMCKSALSKKKILKLLKKSGFSVNRELVIGQAIILECVIADE